VKVAESAASVPNNELILIWLEGTRELFHQQRRDRVLIAAGQ
jgi:hypothetical protein